MRRAWVLLAVVWAGLAQAQIFSEGVPAWAPGKVPYFGAVDASFMQGSSAYALYLPLSTPGCYASGSALGSKGETVTFTRASIKTCFTGSAYVDCQANELCVEPQGARIERAATNYALNSGTHPKTNEATASLPTAAYAAWILGTGTLTLSAGTATTTALSCSAVSVGSICTFTVTVAGTVLLTTTAGVTHVQVENGQSATNPWRSSQITTAGSAVPRAADALSVTIPALGPDYCLGARFGVSGGYLNSVTRNMLLTDGATQIIQMYTVGSSTGTFNTADTGAHNVSFTGTTTSKSVEWLGCTGNGTSKVYRNGAEVGTLSFASGINLPSRTLYIGTAATAGNESDSYIKSVVVCNGPSRANCRVPSQSQIDRRIIVALGDSITSRGSPNYPSTLGGLVGAPYQVMPGGVETYQVAQLLTTWTGGARRWEQFRPGTATILIGVNDLINGACQTSACIIADLGTLYATVSGDGARLVLMTILPFKNAAGWTAQRETDRLAVNAWIKAYCATGAATCVDSATDFDDGTGAMKAGYDSGDGLHPNQAGYDRLAALLDAVLP